MANVAARPQNLGSRTAKSVRPSLTPAQAVTPASGSPRIAGRSGASARALNALRAKKLFFGSGVRTSGTRTTNW
jgi:hypothetical protein